MGNSARAHRDGPDKFKGSLTAVEVARALANGLATMPVEVDQVPVADGVRPSAVASPAWLARSGPAGCRVHARRSRIRPCPVAGAIGGRRLRVSPRGSMHTAPISGARTGCRPHADGAGPFRPRTPSAGRRGRQMKHRRRGRGWRLRRLLLLRLRLPKAPSLPEPCRRERPWGCQRGVSRDRPARWTVRVVAVNRSLAQHAGRAVGCARLGQGCDRADLQPDSSRAPEW
ncbi:glycerate kinase [Microlunatus speluncae]|uniref:glycerate kinase n=1 Tax=Microlunatus speluncae TaxID=2594267 RepID=UPI00126675C5